MFRSRVPRGPAILSALCLCLIAPAVGGAQTREPSQRPAKHQPLSEAAEAAQAAAELPDPLEAGWRGKKVCELLHEAPRLRVLRCSFAPGEGHERHFHAPHFGYTIAGGRMRITGESGTREANLTTSSTWRSDGVKWHEVVNVGDTTAVYLIVEPR